MLLTLSSASVATADQGGQATVNRVRVEGVAQTFFGGCPFVVPPPNFSCHETQVFVFSEASTFLDPTLAPPIPWAVFIHDYTVSFVTGGPDEVPTFSDERTGFLLNPQVAFDAQHLSFLTLDARVPMSDGSTFDFHGNWTSTSKRFVYGNNGPANANDGLLRHQVDSCTTWNANAHQKLVFANMTGTLNGSPVQSYPDLNIDFIGTGHFVYVDVTHGNCT